MTDTKTAPKDTVGDRIAQERDDQTKATERDLAGGKPPVETGGEMEDKAANDLRGSMRDR